MELKKKIETKSNQFLEAVIQIMRLDWNTKDESKKNNNIEFATDQNNYWRNLINQANKKKRRKGEGWQRKIILCAEGWCKTWLHLVSWSNLKCCLSVKRSARSKEASTIGGHVHGPAWTATWEKKGIFTIYTSVLPYFWKYFLS